MLMQMISNIIVERLTEAVSMSQLADKLRAVIATRGWGKVYATEVARESLRYAFEYLQRDDIYSFCSVHNQREQPNKSQMHLPKGACR